MSNFFKKNSQNGKKGACNQNNNLNKMCAYLALWVGVTNNPPDPETLKFRIPSFLHFLHLYNV